MLQLQHLTITQRIDLKILISTLSLTVQAGDKVAIIGEEGVGKSTLLYAMSQPERVDQYADVTGRVVNQFANTVLIPQQLPAEKREETIAQYIFDPKTLDKVNFGLLYQLADQLSFDTSRFDSNQRLATLSGGEQLKLQLIKQLALEPDLLLLDEPSNDLDAETVRWLTHYIQRSTAAVIFISHDETLLTTAANRILHMAFIHNHREIQVNVANLDYETYKSQREHQLQRDSQIARKQREEYQKQLAKYRRIESKVTHQHNQISRQDPHSGRLLKKKMHAVKSMGRRFEREAANFKEIPIDEDAILIKLRCLQPLPQNKFVINSEHYVVRLPDGKALTLPVEVIVKGRDKVGIIGVNGVGKSTLLKALYADLVQRQDLKVGYMPQLYHEVLPMSQTPIEYLCQESTAEERQRVMTYLGSARFSVDEMHHAIQQLSGGQQAKLLLLKMDLEQVNVLLLDEPTRNFSPLSQSEIREIFQNFEGCMIAVSHDPLFLEAVCDRYIELMPTKV